MSRGPKSRSAQPDKKFKDFQILIRPLHFTEMPRYKVKTNHKKYKTRRKKRDVDEVFEDLTSAEKIQRLKHQQYDEDKPGLGQYYCLQCSRYFQDNHSLAHHQKSKVHKRRVRDLRVNPYSTLEAEAASGLNLEKFVAKVEKYKENEPARQEMEKALLEHQIEENDAKDKARMAELFPEAEEPATVEAVPTDKK